MIDQATDGGRTRFVTVAILTEIYECHEQPEDKNHEEQEKQD